LVGVVRKRARARQLFESLACDFGLVAEACELVGVKPAGLAETVDIDAISLVPEQGVGNRVQPDGQQRVEHVDFRAGGVQPLGLGQVIHAGGFEQHTGVGPLGTVGEAEFLELLPVRLISRELFMPTTGAVGAIK
jgi:hypothetical protein